MVKGLNSPESKEEWRVWKAVGCLKNLLNAHFSLEYNDGLKVHVQREFYGDAFAAFITLNFSSRVMFRLATHDYGECIALSL